MVGRAENVVGTLWWPKGSGERECRHAKGQSAAQSRKRQLDVVAPVAFHCEFETVVGDNSSVSHEYITQSEDQ